MKYFASADPRASAITENDIDMKVSQHCRGNRRLDNLRIYIISDSTKPNPETGEIESEHKVNFPAPRY